MEKVGNFFFQGTRHGDRRLAGHRGLPATGGSSAVGRQVDRVRSDTLLSRLDSLVLVACHETRPTVLPTMVGAP